MSNKQQAIWQQGQRHTQHQQWRQAAAAYEAIVDHDRGFLPAWLELSMAKEKLDGYRDAYRAVVEASRIRMRPILMTALATVVGLLPIALELGEGSEASAPLARAAVGGLAVSTVLTLILVPALYELFYARRHAEA